MNQLNAQFTRQQVRNLIEKPRILNHLKSYSFFFSGPASPIIEDLQLLPDGLDISWKSDVTSKQDKYVIVYVRNDTGRPTKINTTNPRVSLTNLYPGAGYTIKVYALSHSLPSEPHILFRAVFPNPPRDFVIDSVDDNKVTLRWQEPLASLYTGYVIRYRPLRDREPSSWTEEDTDDNTYTLDNLLHGEEYEIELDSVSHRVPSGKPLSVKQIIKPKAIENFQPILDAKNVTLQWPKPEGRVDVYHIKWYPRSNPDAFEVKEIQSNIQSRNGRSIEVLITDLHPGVEYVFETDTEAHNLRSEARKTFVRTMPLITSEITVINQPEVTTALTLRYTPTPLTSSLFDTYRFELSDAKLSEKAAQDPDRKVTFVDLVPGRLYNITLWTVSGGVTSKPLERQDRLHPEPVSSLSAERITDKEITLVWQKPVGDYDHFDVIYYDGRDRLSTNSTLINKITIGRLRPFKNYTFSVVTISGTSTTIQRRSSPISAQFATKESVPGSLTSFEPKDFQPSKITFQWELPDTAANGIITGFVIEYHRSDEVDLQAFQREDFGPADRQGTIKNLIPGVEYVFKIKARTRVGFGSTVRWKQEMPIWAPPVPDRTVKPTEGPKTMTTITISFRRNYFSDEHGKVTSYAIIVAEDSSKSTDNKLSLPTWRDVHNLRIWPPYQASDPYYPFNNTSREDFVVGVEENCGIKEGYCNGPLKPNYNYRFKIRAYTTANSFSETHWSDAIQTDPDNTPLVIGIIVSVIVLLLATLVILAIKFGFACYVFNFKRALPGDMRDNISLPDSVIETSKPVKLKDFAEHYRIMSADSDFRFSEEYEELKHVGREKPCTAADMPVNRPKNRFTNILPYDHSRVKLQPSDDDEGSDFINANFVPGFNSPREFIVTQGPLHSTRDDFWRMCWETNSRAIVMLTRCVEKGREKCDHYWPYDTQPVFYGDIQVTILNESHFPDWNISEFRMMRGDTVRTIRHFHFTTWPDFGVPEPPQTLVRFVRAYRERVTPEQRPVVVHCSAGVGRSGTFIALDRILQVN